MSVFKRLAARLPDRWQSELKRVHFRRQILGNRFTTSEPEYRILGDLLKPGDWALDIGANVGHYTQRFSELVGAGGRVVAFEPVPATLALLAANSVLFAHPNVTLINAAVSDATSLVGMTMPRFSTGLRNYYEAQISAAGAIAPADALNVLAISIDSLELAHPVALAKIDAEGHEASVLRGMQRLLERDHPIVIVETGSQEVIAGLEAMGYAATRLPGSPNVLCRPKG